MDIQVTHNYYTQTLLNGLTDVQLRVCTVICYIFAVKIFSYAENVGYENILHEYNSTTKIFPTFFFCILVYWK